MPVKKRTLFIFACIISVLYACKKDGGGGGIPAGSGTFPLNVGSKWVYDVTINMQKAGTTEHYTCYWEVEREDTALGKKVKVLRKIVMKTGSTANPDTAWEYLYQDSSGLYVIATEGTSSSSSTEIFFKDEEWTMLPGLTPVVMNKTSGKSYPAPALYLLKYPQLKGNKWNSYEYTALAEATRAYGDVVTTVVPAGTFATMKLLLTLKGMAPVEQYLNAQKGLVRQYFRWDLRSANGYTDVLTSEAVLRSTNL
jgi:hypothetical protein